MAAACLAAWTGACTASESNDPMPVAVDPEPGTTAEPGGGNNDAGQGSTTGSTGAASDAASTVSTGGGGGDETDAVDEGTSSAGDSESGTVEPPSGLVVVETVAVYDADGQGVDVPMPADAAPGDLLVLVLHRTDDDLPLFVEGWDRVAECYKGDNDLNCSTEADCTDWHDDNFCRTFDGNGGGNGHDLAQAVFVREVAQDTPASFTFDLNRPGEDDGHPGWVILSTVRGADTDAPVRDWAHTGCDDDPNSVFPSVQADAGDLLLLSQSFDDAVPQAWFEAPVGMDTLGYVSEDDEAGFLFGGVVERSGPTGVVETLGDGGPACKDALVSLSIAPAQPK